MDMDIYIDGELISDIVAFEGFQRSFRYVEGLNGGTTLSGKTHKDVLADKNVFAVDCIPLPPARYNGLKALLGRRDVTVMLVDPDEGTSELTMFAALPEGVYDKSCGLWTGVKFTLEEK